MPIDVAIAGLPFERQMIERATHVEFAPGVELRIATPENVIVTKAFAGRPLDWSDVEGVMIRQGRKLNWSYIRREIKVLAELKEAPEIVDQLKRLKEKIDAE